MQEKAQELRKHGDETDKAKDNVQNVSGSEGDSGTLGETAVGPEDQPQVEVTQQTKAAAHALRQLAEKLENGELGNVDFALVIPKRENGDMPLLFLGNPVPQVMLEGLLHRMLTKMALQG